MSNYDLVLADIAGSIKDLEINGTDTDGIEQELYNLSNLVENLNNDLNERLDKLIEVLKNERCNK